MVEERAAAFTKRSIKTGAKLAGLKMVVSMMDLTTLEGKDTPGKVAYLCRKAIAPADPRFGVPSCAAVCVYPNLVRAARRFLGDSGVKVAAVATAFPSGAMLRVKLPRRAQMAVEFGADEIDMVIDRGAFLAGEIRARDRRDRRGERGARRAHLKVIFETGELQTYDNVRRMSDLAMRAGADFIKTSTGKVAPAATLPVTLVMLEAIRDLLFRDGHSHRHETRRWHPHCQGVPRSIS